MASERYLEILLTRSIPIVFGNEYSLLAQQLTLPSGRLDFVLNHVDRSKHIIELKKDNAKPEAVDQILGHLHDYRSYYDGQIFGWVVANGIPPQTHQYAKSNEIRTLTVPTENYSAIMAEADISQAELLGQRVQAGILIGGGVQNFNKNAVSFEAAINQLDEKVKAFVLGSGPINPAPLV